MRVNERMKKVFSILLCLCMVLQYVPTTAFAATTAEGGLCEHHTEHTAECGYAEVVEGQPCTHVHDELCGYIEAVAEVKCACEATDENGALVHTEGCGYVAPVEGSNCTHVHDEACGYAAAVEAHECHYECAECAAAAASEEPSEESSEPAPVCDCGTDDALIHATTCAVYVDPENPQCFCVEKCTEPNVWCDVCGLDYTACTGTDTAVTWDGVDLSCNTSSFGNNRGTWYLNPDNAATEFYNLIDDKLIGGYGYVPERTYITTNESDYRDNLGNDGFLWTDCKNQTIQDGRYYIYVFSRSADQFNRIEYIVDVQVRYTVNISVTGAPSGYGGVTLNGSNAGSPQYLEKGDDITLTVKDVPSHKHTVTYDSSVTCTQNGDTYAFSNVNKSFTFKVVYEADEFATVSFGQPEGATVSVNGNSTSPVRVTAGMPYTVSVKTNDGYYLTGITVDGTTTSLDTTSYNKNLTAGANGAGHTISVTTAKVAIPVNTTASITYTKNQDKASLVNAMKDAVYAGSDNNIKNSLTVNYLYFGDFYNPIDDYTDIWESVLTAGEMFSCNVKESVSIKLSSGDVYSQSCTLYLYDGDISAKGEIKKDYTEEPVKLDGNDFNCAYPANFTSSYPVEYRYYTQSGQRLSSAPTEVGKYQVQVKASSYYKANPDAIIGTSWTSWSGLIPFEIVSVPAYSITVENSSGGRVTASKETSIAGKTVTLTIEPDVGYLVDTVAYNGTAITPVEGVYSFAMPAGAVTISATFKACTHETYENGICTLCGVQHAVHTGGEATCTEQAVCTVCGASYGEVGGHTPGENATYTVGTDGTHSYTCTVCGTTVTEEHTYGDEDGTCACGLVKTYTITLSAVGAKIVAVNGEAVELLPGGTFTVQHGQELTVKFENTLSQKETGVYCDAWDAEGYLIDYDYDEATNIMTISANKVNSDIFIGATPYVSVQFNLHGGALTKIGEGQFNSDRCAWNAETSTLKVYYDRIFDLLSRFFQLGGHTFAGMKVDGSDDVVQSLDIHSDMTVDILWECDGTTLTYVPAKDATCMEAGNIAHYVCTCGKLYAEDKTTLLTAEDVKTDIDPNAHGDGFDPVTGECANCSKFVAAASVTTGGATTYYETLDEALEIVAACTAEDNAVVKLMDDYAGAVTLKGVFTLDMNEKEITADKSEAVTVAEDAVVTVTGNGTVTNDKYRAVENNGTLTVENGTFTALEAGIRNYGLLYINGGSFTATNTQPDYYGNLISYGLYVDDSADGTYLNSADAVFSGYEADISLYSAFDCTYLTVNVDLGDNKYTLRYSTSDTGLTKAVVPGEGVTLTTDWFTPDKNGYLMTLEDDGCIHMTRCDHTSFAHTDNGDFTHDSTCTACGRTYTNNKHNLINRTCVDCGWTEGEDDGLKEDANGDLCYYFNGEVLTSYTGFAENDDGIWDVYNGKVDKTVTRFASYNGKACYIVNGRIDSEYDGVYINGYAKVYLKDGIQDISFTGLAETGEQETSLDKNALWYVKDGAVEENETPIIVEVDGTRYLITEGKVAADVTGEYKLDGVTHCVKAGVVGHDYVNGTCTICGEPCDHSGNKNEAADQGNGKHSFTCTVCQTTVTEEHTGGTATCKEKAKCEHCGASYGELADHSTSYSADGMTITYKCATCDTQTVTFTLVIPTGAVYGSSAMAVPHYDSSDKTYQGDYPEITLDGALLKDFVPGAKTYEVVMTWGDKTVSGEYTIAPKELTAADVTITLSPDSFLYDGLEKLPTVTIKLGDKVLDGGTYAAGYDDTNTTCDYQLVIPYDRVTPGQKAITIFFRNNYSGEAVVRYTITIPEATLSPSEPNGENGWYKSASLLAPDGYAISETKNGVGTSLVIGDGTHTAITYWLSYVANKEPHGTSLTWTGSIKVDGTAPTVSGTAGSITDSTASVTVTADDALSGVESVTLTCADASVTIGALTDGAFPVSGMQPNTAYTFTLTAKDEAGNETVATVNLTTEKDNSSATAAPTPNTLTYTGEGQYLISAGEANGGTMVYSLTENGEYTTSIPQGTNAGDYTVWYYVQGDANHNDSAKDSVDVTIAKADVGITAPTPNTLTYTGEAHNLITQGEVEGGTMVYSLTENGDYTTSIPQGTNAGDYTVWYYVQGDANHNDSAKASVDVTIKKATPVVTPPTPREGMPFNNTFFTLLAENAQTTGGTLMYKVNDGEWRTNTHDNWNAGTYNVYWKVVGNGNYESVDTGAYITVTVQHQELDKINPTVTLSPESFVYDGAAKTPDVSIVADLPYISLDGSNYTNSDETLEEGKDFTVTYAENVNPGTTTVTIQGIGNFKGTVTRTFTITCDHSHSEEKYTNNGDGTHDKVCSVCGDVIVDNQAHHGTATYAVNAEDSTKHDVTYSCCGVIATEDHDFENEAHKCVCGKAETFTVYWASAESLRLETGTSTFGQDFVQTITVPENTHLRIDDVYLRSDSSIHVNYTYENGVLTIAAEDLPAGDIEVLCDHYVEVTFCANGGVIMPHEGYPKPGDTGFAEDGSYWMQENIAGGELNPTLNAELLRTGYTFVGWRDVSGKVYPMGSWEGKFVIATEDVTLYAQWQCNHTIGGVVFRDNGNGTHNGYCGECDEPLGNYVERPHAYDETTHQCVCGVFKPFNLYADGQTLAVAYGSDLADAVADITPEKTGYTHTGEWTYYSLDEYDVKQSYTGTTMPAVELYAEPVYEAIQYNITWDMAGCSYYVNNYDGLPTKLAYNVDGNAHNVNFTDITAPEGYEFVRFEDGDGNALSYVITDKYRLNLTVSGDMTVKAVIEPKTYKATWVSFDGSSRSVNVKYGETIIVCDHEPIPGYTFLRWEGYTEDMTMPAKDVTFTAIYQVNQYTITFNTDGGSAVASITQDYGTAVTAPAAPSKDGYHFVEWQDLPTTMPAENVTIKAVWEAHKDHTYSASGNTITAKCGVCGEVVGTVSITAESKTYDGTPAAVDYHCSGVVDPNEVGPSFTKDGRYVNGEDLAEEGAYTASITLGMGEDAATASVDFTIAKKELTATVSGSMSKSYDGTNIVPERHSLKIVLDGVISGDTVTASADFAFAGVNAGTTTINATNIALSGKDAANYELKATTASADVGEIVVLDLQYLEPHDYDIVFGTEPVYNGKEQTMTVESFVMCGLDVTYELTGNTGTDAGFYTMVVTANGNFAGTITQDWQISRKAVTVTAEDQMITYGETISGTEITADGLVDGHSVTMTLTPSTANVTANGTITASAAAITADGTDVTGNYNVSYTSGKLVIKPDTSKIDGLTSENVTSDDEETIKAVQEMLENADSITEEWEDIGENCEDLLDRIEETEAEQKELTDQAATFDEDTVKSTDKENLEQLAKDIEDLLDTDNLTEDEREALETVLEQVESMIDTIEDTAEDSKAATEKIDALDPTTVTSDDKDELEQAIETIDKLLTADHLTEDERKALEDAKVSAEALIEKIEAVQDATDTENTEKVEDVTAENVKPEDKEALEDAKADLEKALEDNAGNYTEEEKKTIQDEIQRIEDAIEALENVEDVTDAITQLPETVEPDDEEVAEKILDAKEAYDELTDHEKSLVDEDTKKKLDNLVASLTAYDIIKGDGGKWTKGGSSGLTFTANGPFSKFVGIEVDGKEVAARYYEAKSGSTIITLKQSFLKKLSTGEHTITVLYTDGEASGTFKILAASSTPATGDNSNIMLYSSMFTVSLAGLVVLLLAAKKRKQETA